MKTRHMSWWILTLAVFAALAVGAAAWGEAAKKEDAKAGPTVTPPPPASESEMQQPGTEEPKTGPMVMAAYRIEDFFISRDWGSSSLGIADVLDVGEETDFWTRQRFNELFGGGSPRDVRDEGIGWQELLDVIKRAVNNLSNLKVAAWADEGGPATIDWLSYDGATVLLVSQTREGQKQVESLLKMLRGASEVGGSLLAIHARWVEMADAKVAELLGRDPAKRQVPIEVTDADLAKADAKTIYRGGTTCFDRQTVFVASGNLKVYMDGVTPLISESYVGVKSNLHQLVAGGVLEVRPQLSGDKDSVLLDYRSYVNQNAKVERKAHQEYAIHRDLGGPLATDLDFPAVDFQTLRGSVRIPLGKSILLGFTTGPKLKDGKVSCLILEVSASKAETRP